MAETTFSKSDLIKKGWGATKANKVILLEVLLIFIAVSIVTSFIENNVGALRPLVGIISTVIDTVLEIGIFKIALDIANGKTPNIKDLYMNYNRFLEFFITSLAVGIMIVVGFILLIIPGIYLGVKFQFTPYIVVDKNLAYSKAWSLSSQMVKGRWMSIFLFDLTLLGLNILGALALGIGLFLTIPTSLLATVYLYKKLS